MSVKGLSQEFKRECPVIEKMDLEDGKCLYRYDGESLWLEGVEYHDRICFAGNKDEAEQAALEHANNLLKQLLEMGKKG